MKFNFSIILSFLLFAIIAKGKIIYGTTTTKTITTTKRLNEDLYSITKRLITSTKSVYSSPTPLDPNLTAKDVCGNNLYVFIDVNNFICYREPILIDVGTSIDYLYIKKGFSKGGKNYYIEKSSYEACTGTRPKIPDCLESVAKLLNRTHVASIFPQVETTKGRNYFTPIEDSDIPDTTKSNEIIIREYFCGKDSIYINKNDEHLCLIPLRETISDSLESVRSKNIIYYKNHHYYVNELYSTVCTAENISVDECIEIVAEMLDETVESITPNEKNTTEGPFDISRYDGTPPSLDFNNRQNVMESFTCSSKSHVSYYGLCLDYFEFNKSLNATEMFQNNIFYANNNYYSIIKKYTRLDVQFTDPYLNYQVISRLFSQDLVSLVPKITTQEELNELVYNNYVDRCGGDDYFMMNGSEYLCLQPLTDPLPPSIQEIMNNEIFYYNKNYYTLNKRYSTVCGKETEVIVCYEEVARVLNVKLASLVLTYIEN